jgi:hypothetical protein
MDTEPIYAPPWPNRDGRPFVACFPDLPITCAVCGATNADRTVYGRFVPEATGQYRCVAAFCVQHMPDDWYHRPPEPQRQVRQEMGS